MKKIQKSRASGLNVSPEPSQRLAHLIEILKGYKPERIYLFGSWARGEWDDLSDIDLVLIKKTRRSFLDRLRDVGKLLPPEIGGVDILVYTPSEFVRMKEQGNAFVEMILEEGQLIYDDKEDTGSDALVSTGAL
jgi:predicted nucleotidyltransferase